MAFKATTSNPGPFSTSDLPINPDGRIYHLGLKPDELAPLIVLVGDPERATWIAEHCFRSVEVEREHRGLRTVTGIDREHGRRVSAVTSGMGTPSLEIVLNELTALNEIDFSTRRRKPHFEPLRIIRVGTSGGLQADTPLGTAIVTSYAIGMDNTGLFYDVPVSTECRALEERVNSELAKLSPVDSNRRPRPYVTAAHSGLVLALEQAATKLGCPHRLGVTVSNSGFYSNQGRNVGRVPPTLPDLDHFFAQLDLGLPDQRIENMEMESSFLFHFAGGHGYPSASICPTVAHRRTEKFAANLQECSLLAARVALAALTAEV